MDIGVGSYFIKKKKYKFLKRMGKKMRFLLSRTKEKPLILKNSKG